MAAKLKGTLLPFFSFFFKSTVWWSTMLAAVMNGDAKELAELMRQDPGFDVNMAVDGYGCTLLPGRRPHIRRDSITPGTS